MMSIHYKPKKISEIRETDSKISLIGKVVESTENTFILEDDTGRVEFFSENIAETEKLVRVFSTIIEGKLKADAIQVLNGFDLNLYNRIKELYLKAGV